MNDRIILDTLEVECIIGIFDWERKAKQRVVIDLDLRCDMRSAAMSDNIKDAVDYKTIAKNIIAFVEPSSFELIETLSQKIADLCLSDPGVTRATVRVSKPGAVRGSKNISVQITRPIEEHIIYMGVGSNIEPGINIPEGIKLIKERFLVEAISPTYKSCAWGVKEKQEDYLNLAVKASTGKDLFGVRAELRWIEEIMGRKRTVDKFSPRTLDIDLLLYDNLVFKDEGGALPHPQLLTQQFVYLPMMDIVKELIVPGAGQALKDIEPEYEDKALEIVKLD